MEKGSTIIEKAEGEFIGGLLYGKVKEYDENGKIVFEGEYDCGNLWKGKSGWNRFSRRIFKWEKMDWQRKGI